MQTFQSIKCQKGVNFLSPSHVSYNHFIQPHHTTCTVANALNVTFLGNSGPGDPRVFMTGFNGVRGFSDNSPADAANSLKRWENPCDVVLSQLSVTSTDCWTFGTTFTVADGCRRYT